MNRTPPLISVITPAFNAERFIGDTIKSVQAQTYTHWEMIIVDDASTDETAAVVEQFRKDDPRIQLIRLKTNGGPAVARNTAIDQAQGRYFAFLDADDMWLPEKLEKQLRFMQDNQIAFSFTKYITVHEDGTKTNSVVNIPEQVHYRQLLKHNVIGCLTVMLDTAMIGPVKMVDMRSRQDFALWLDLCKRGFTAYGLREVLAKYRITSHSLSRNKLKMAKQNWKIYRDVEQLTFLSSIWYFANYVYYSLKKYMRQY